MEVIPIEQLKESFIYLMVDQIIKMSDKDFLNLISTIDLFSKDDILTFESLDSFKIKNTFLNGVNSLINFLECLDLKNDEKEYIKLNLRCIKNILGSIINKKWVN